MAVTERDAGEMDDDVVRVSRWLMSADGQAMVQREMRRCGLPGAYDADLAEMTEHAARRMAARGDAIQSIPAWTTQTFRRRAMDLLKSPAFARRETVDDSGWEVVGRTDGPGGRDGIEDVLAALQLADIRRHIGRSVPRSGVGPWPVSASLSFLSVAVDGCAPGRQCPTPVGGVDEFDSAHWAALYYAGETGCFAPGRAADSPAIRQRRKRRIDAVRTMLAEAYASTSDQPTLPPAGVVETVVDDG